MEIIVSEIVGYISLILYIYVILSIITLILLENRNPAKSLVWILVLTFLPILGVIFYAFLGQDFRRKKIISKKSLNYLRRRPKINPLSFNQNKELHISDETKRVINLLSKNSKSPVYAKNKITVFTNGKETFESIFTDIENAKEHIHIEFYIVDKDKTGTKLRNLLIKKAKEGVRIRFIYDYLGGFSLSKQFLQPMRNEGIYVQAFLPAHPNFGFGKINCRNHRKLIVIDGKIGYTGGMNVADRYICGNKLGAWRDTQVKLEGAAVHGLQNIFLIDWSFVDNKLITDSKYYPDPTTFKGTKNLIQIVGSGPDTDWQNIMQGIISTINSAKEYIYIQTPYFLPTEPILSALQIASLSGVEIKIMIPEKSDTRMVHRASKSYIRQTLEAGIKVFFYQNAFLHSKAIVIDDHICTIGSSNMDFRSYEQNFELNAFIYDRTTSVQLRKAFNTDLKQCREITLEEWKKRKKPERLKDSFARLFSPLL